jgi:hypothetical protein
MNLFRYVAALLLASAVTSLAHAQIFYNNTGTQNVVASFKSSDEIADDTPFSGTQHVASFTFDYENLNSFPVDATVRFYTVNPSTGHVGDLVATIPVPSLAPGSFQLVTVNLPASQQFDWTATPGIYNLSNVSGGFVSFQFTGPDHQTGWYEATGASLDDFYDVTTGQVINFSGDASASFYLQLSGTAQAPTLSNITLKSSSIQGGTITAARVTLTAPAPAGGLIVKLMSSKPSVARLPATVTIPAGSKSATVRIQTQVVQKPTLVTVSAAQGTTLRLADLTVTP